MKMRTFLAVGVSALFGLCLAVMFVGTTVAQRPPSGKDRTDLINDVQTPRPPAPGAIGRYQGAVSQTHFCLFDTVTGQVWMARAGEAWKPVIEQVKP